MSTTIPANTGVLSRIVEVFLRGNLSVLLILIALVAGAVALLVTPREEEPQIVDAIAQHREALDAHAEGVTREVLVVDTDMAKDLGVDHSATEDLEPAGMAADTATLATTHHALDVSLGRWLGERKVGGTETYPEFLLEKGNEEVVQDALEIAEGDLLVDHETLDLVEHGGMRQIGVAAIDTAGGDHAQWWLAVLHGADLHR